MRKYLKRFPKFFRFVVIETRVWIKIFEEFLMRAMWKSKGSSEKMFENKINPFPNKPWFLHVCSTSLLKTLWEKEKLLVTSNFSFSNSVFYPFGELSAILIKFKNCHLQTLSVWKRLKFVIWERVNAHSYTQTDTGPWYRLSCNWEVGLNTNQSLVMSYVN